MFLLCPTSAIVVDTGLYLALHGLSDFGNVVDIGLKQESMDSILYFGCFMQHSVCWLVCVVLLLG